MDVVLNSERSLLSALDVVDDAIFSPKQTLFPCKQICVTLDRDLVMPVVCQFVRRTSLSPVTTVMAISFHPAAVYICPLLLPFEGLLFTSGHMLSGAHCQSLHCPEYFTLVNPVIRAHTHPSTGKTHGWKARIVISLFQLDKWMSLMFASCLAVRLTSC